MLILERMEEDRIIVKDRETGKTVMTIKILDVGHRSGKVRIGIEATQELRIFRGELFESSLQYQL